MTKRKKAEEKRDKKLEIDNLKKQIRELKEKAASFEANWKRALADYQNLEKRIVSERTNQAKLAAKDLLVSLLPVFDSFREAAKQIKNEGLTIAFKQLMNNLKDQGVREIKAEGKHFDPNIMEAVEVVESERENIVVKEVRSGYLLYEDLLRPAQVVVGKRKTND